MLSQKCCQAGLACMEETLRLVDLATLVVGDLKREGVRGISVWCARTIDSIPHLLSMMGLG